MIDYKKIFKDKKITVMGLGLLGGALNDIHFLIEHGAKITVTDLKSNIELKSSVDKLKKYTNIKFVLGRHDIKDFKNADMVLHPGNVPTDSPYLKEARKNNIPIFVSESLFAKYEPGVIMVGVTGTRGKSMTTALIYEILSKNLKGKKASPTGRSYGQVYIAGNVRDVSTLALLGKVKKGDIVVMELDSWALHGFGDIKKSPHISVFTTFMPDHMNFYRSSMKKYFEDKANIFKYQTRSDTLIIRPNMKTIIPKNIKSKLIVAQKKDVAGWSFVVPGEHQRENLACAVEVAKQFKIPVSKIKITVKNFMGIEGRLQYVKTIRGIKIYNDNNATTPEATTAGIEALLSIPGMDKKSIVLIAGGADKGLKTDGLVRTINKYCKAVVLLEGTGTKKLISEKLKVQSYKVNSLKEAINTATKYTKKGDIILFSPAFASFGMFTNEYDRNDQFMKIVKKLK